MNNRKTITTTLPNGMVQEYDVILTFTNDYNNKDYIVYTDNKYDENNKLRIFAAIYNPDTYEFIKTPTSKEEWYEINELLEKILMDNR